MSAIIKAIKENTEKLNFHRETREIGERFVFCDSKLIPNSSLYSIVRVFENVDNENRQNDYIEAHSHKTDSLWMFFGKNKDLTGLKVLVEIDGREEIIETPATVYIPSHSGHKYIPLKGDGYYINILLTDGMEYNELTY